MSQIEPAIETFLDDIYVENLAWLKKRLVQLGSTAPRAEALALMSLAEGLAWFVGRMTLLWFATMYWD